MNGELDIVAICALLVSVISIILGFFGLYFQRQHNVLSVRPIGNIGLFQSPDTFAISIVNNGTGPMMIKSVKTVNMDGSKKDYPVEWIPLGDRQYFWGNLEGTAINNGTKVDILVFKFDISKPNQIRKREEIRSILKNLTIQIKYDDMYQNNRPDIIKSLDYFGEEIGVKK